MFNFSKNKILLVTAICSLSILIGCDSGGGGLSQPLLSSSAELSSSSVAVPVDYSKARAMNARLGRGINFGNSWESQGTNDCGWSNCIKDEYFSIVKEAGFNSIRIPVRWNHDADTLPPYTLSAERLAGVKEDIEIALSLDMPVIVNIHHYAELISAKGEALIKEKARYTAIWRQVAEALEPYPDSMVVFELLNEPNGMADNVVNELIDSGYTAIREKSLGKTIMINPNGFAKFYLMNKLILPQDGNLIITGHYYEPYTFSHQGAHGQPCGGIWTGDKYAIAKFESDFNSFVQMALQYFPDVNGGHIPLNMGEFGVSGVNTRGCETEELPSDAQRGLWTRELVRIAESHNISWHYWGFSRVGGFEAYDRDLKAWYPELIDAMMQR